jgi:hypothetical protein
MLSQALRQALLTISASLFLGVAFSQQVDINLSLNSGLFSFAGASAASSSFINFDEDTHTAYTNHPFGSQNGFGYGLSANLKVASNSSFIYGLDLGYEIMKSRIAIDGISTSGAQIAATGETSIHYQFINLFPFLGYRLQSNKKIFFDITLGLDNAYCLKATEKGKATMSDGTVYATNVDRKTITTDIRPRIQLSANYERVGVYIGYSLGLRNYLVDYVGGTNECYSRIIRFGLSYRLKKVRGER